MTATYYLPLNNFHIVSIRSLEPDQIKLSAKKHTTHDREEIKFNTLLNCISKSLGFSGGFSGYKKEYTSKLIPFFKQHNLKKKVDLIEKKDSLSALANLKRQDLSERLFFHHKELPKKVYTGYNSDFIDKFSKSQYEARSFNNKVAKFENKHISKIDFHEYRGLFLSGRSDNIIHQCADKLYQNIVNNIKIALDDDFYFEDNSDFFSNLLLGTLYDNNILDFYTQITFLSDNLFYPQTEPVEIELYNYDNDKKIKLEFIFKFFRTLLNKQTEGWIEIIPFNDNLIFLKSDNGDYDFIFKNQRDSLFNHQIYGDNIKRKDVPNNLSKYHFKRWNYFCNQGFRYSDYHNAEKMYYANGGQSRNYPGREVILKEYYTSKGIYSDLKSSPSDYIIPSFKKVLINDEYYAVSELVTIKDFVHFFEENKTRFEDDSNFKLTYSDFFEANAQEEDFPVCVNWFNMMHYISWFNQKHDISSRLLTINEFSIVRGDNDISIAFDKDIAPHEIMLLTEDATKGMPHRDSYHNEHKYNSILINDKKWINPQYKLSFMRSNYFAEWLAEETCVRTGSIEDFYYSYNSSYESLKRSTPPLDSNGMYKGVKIGFRLIYKLSCNI